MLVAGAEGPKTQHLCFISLIKYICRDWVTNLPSGPENFLDGACPAGGGSWLLVYILGMRLAASALLPLHSLVPSKRWTITYYESS